MKRKTNGLKRLARRISHYRFFRKHGYTIRAAWFKSALVIN